MNTHFDYEHKTLWEDKAWDSRMSPLIPLFKWIGRKNYEMSRIPAKPVAERRNDGYLDTKANALTYPEVVAEWKARGLHYHCTSMTLPWIAMIPLDHMEVSGYADEMDTVLVLVNADLSDPSFGMYTLERCSELLGAAARDRFAILFLFSDSPELGDQYISITQEAIILFHLNFHRMFLDVSTVYMNGTNLNAIPDFTYLDQKMSGVRDPDKAVRRIGKAALIDISGQWTNKDSLIFKLVKYHGSGNMKYDRTKLMDSDVGKMLAEAMAIEFKFDDVQDPRLLEYWESLGVKCEFHEREGEQWISFVPLEALGNNQATLPCVCILQEVNSFDPHQAITAFSFFLEFIKIAAQGECMLLFFALESHDDNDLLHDILADAMQLYPLERSRVYITGHSHNGRFSAEYMRRHQGDIAALATLGNEPGQLSPKYTSGFFQITDEQIAIQASIDTPTINISGFNERNSMFPLHGDAPYVYPGQWVALNSFERRSESWQRRLRSARCRERSVEEIAATKDSTDTVERLLGFPADRTEILSFDRSENYIADIMNVDGNYHLRIVALGNMPHMVTPMMLDLAWSYMRRFAKDQKTGACIELF